MNNNKLKFKQFIELTISLIIKFIIILSAIVLFNALIACVGKIGHHFLEEMSHSEISANLIPNKTTSVQVKAKFGDPEEIDLLDNGREQCICTIKRYDAKGVNFVKVINTFYRGTNYTIKKLKIMNNQSRVEKFAFSFSQGQTRLGAFQ